MYLVVQNTFVHLVMYGYYFLTIWNPDLGKSGALKQNVTRLQIVSCLYAEANRN